MKKLKDALSILKGLFIFIGGVVAFFLIKRNADAESDEEITDLIDENDELEEENSKIEENISHLKEDITEVKEDITEIKKEIKKIEENTEDSEDLDDFFDNRGF